MEFDTFYVVERILFITLYSILFILFGIQNYIRVFRATQKQRFITPANAKGANQLAGLSASFWAIICWIDVHHVFLSVTFVRMCIFVHVFRSTVVFVADSCRWIGTALCISCIMTCVLQRLQICKFQEMLANACSFYHLTKLIRKLYFCWTTPHVQLLRTIRFLFVS